MADAKVLLTGISGFVGSNLTRRLLETGFAVAGMVLKGEDVSGKTELSRAELITGNLLDLKSLENCIEATRPDYVIHLAAESAPSKSFAEPERFYRTNVTGTQNLFEAVRRCGTLRRLLIFTSANVYGVVEPGMLPLTEACPLNPMNPYSVTKAACHYMAQQYVMHFKLPIVEIRPFNMIGPGQAPGFVLPDFAKQIAQIIKSNRAAEMKIGSLDSGRDFVDIRDAVKAITELLSYGTVGEVYHICSGKAVKIQEMLDMLLELAGVEIEVTVDQSLLRPTLMPLLYGSHKKVSDLTGWQPAIALKNTVKDTLDYWLNLQGQYY